MAGTSGSIPDFEVNVFGQLCKPAHRPSTMADTSGCIPDFEVNVFGQVCKPARRLSPIPEEEEPDADAEGQTNRALVPLTGTKEHVPKPDPISELFQKNQVMIQSLSCGDVEAYIANVKNVFKEVRQSRRDVREDHVEGQGTAVVRQACLCREYSPAQTQEAEVRLPREEVCQFPAACRCIEGQQDQQHSQLCRQFQSQRDSSAHQFTIKHFEQDEDKATLSYEEQRKGKWNRVCSHVIM